MQGHDWGHMGSSLTLVLPVRGLPRDQPRARGGKLRGGSEPSDHRHAGEERLPWDKVLVFPPLLLARQWGFLPRRPSASAPGPCPAHVRLTVDHRSILVLKGSMLKA